MIKVAIVDDSDSYLSMIIEILLKYGFVKEEIYYFDSSKKCLSSKIDFSLYLVEIDLPEKAGLDIIKKLRDKNVFVIYVTACSKHLKNAFDKNVIGYVLKNKLNAELPLVLNKFFEILSEEKELQFTYKNGLVSIKITDIMYIKSDLGDLIIITNKAEFRILNKSLSSIYTILQDNFCYCSRNVIVNMDYISSILNNTICLKNGIKLNINRRRYKTLFIKYMHYKFK